MENDQVDCVDDVKKREGKEGLDRRHIPPTHRGKGVGGIVEKGTKIILSILSILSEKIMIYEIERWKRRGVRQD
jgi:hypothetical protein